VNYQNKYKVLSNYEVYIYFKQLLVFVRFQCFGMLQVRENEISLRKCSGGTAHLRGKIAWYHYLRRWFHHNRRLARSSKISRRKLPTSSK